MTCEHIIDFANDWCTRCGVTLEVVSQSWVRPPDIDVVLPGIVGMSPDAFKRWSRQHGVRWEPVDGR